jgi:hypothetical protein
MQFSLTKVLYSLVAAQNFEYKMSNILDKPTESLFGYIGVLVSVSRPLLIFGILIYYVCSPELSLHIGMSIARWLRFRVELGSLQIYCSSE